ncbi:hypothetical protein KJ657_02905 [Patescibacteria group bacterium]|nr:hypothetical protein [Patescibacteria group bacterium]MBU1016014.1 hypothetical protein [Patescibacteria group bacterium]MBU1684639.1 hypothetical protein [Patescibacteria group bacterium]MBU1939079.1 hypothetical protein [Patescibacteria group bacterium]
MYRKTIQIDHLIPTGSTVCKNIQASLARQSDHTVPPVHVIRHPKKDGYYFLYDGHNRVYYAANHGEEKIRADVLETIDEIVENGGPYFQLGNSQLTVELEGLLRTEKELAVCGIRHILHLALGETDEPSENFSEELGRADESRKSLG